jgi:phosphatidylglycerol---prolipoprotein diacylglyceryl transferase
LLHEFAASVASSAANAIQFTDLGLDPVVFKIGFFSLRWYSLGYIAGIAFAWWYVVRMLGRPGAPMARRHADDFVFYATLGIILGGRLGYVLFYKPELLATPLDVFKVWEGGMAFHGGLAGLIIAILYFSWRNTLPLLRVLDYIGCGTPIGIFLVRIANFINGELWGRPTDVPWAIVFPGTGDGIPRHPSQLYEAGLEGLALFALLWWMFWKTDARYYPGRLAGAGLTFYAIVRFALERVRQPDAGLENLWWGMFGLWLLVTSKSRRVRVEPLAGSASVA